MSVSLFDKYYRNKIRDCTESEEKDKKKIVKTQKMYLILEPSY